MIERYEVSTEGLELVNEVRVPANEARSVEVQAGQLLEVIDLEGQQVGDLISYRLSDATEVLSPAHTISSLGKIVPGVGDDLLSNHRTSLLRIVRDDVGSHDLMVPCCDPERYSRDYGVEGHASCLGSLEAAVAASGRDWPVRGQDAWNVFMNNKVEDGRIVTYEPPHPAGSLIAMEVLEDQLVVLSACPQDLSAVNAFNPTSMALRVWGPIG